MRYKAKVFNESEVIRYFMENDFKQIPSNKLMDVVMDIRTHEIELLKSWEAHFKNVKAPHAITRSDNDDFIRPYTDYRIWVERKAGNG